MKITALVENISNCGLKAVHGLSFYITTEKHKILFDMGPDNSIIENAGKLGINLSEIDIAFISHGHRDHGGALELFLDKNSKAKVYVQKKAFESHTSRPAGQVKDISLDRSLMNHPQMALLEGGCVIDEELELFTVTDNSRCHSDANDTLYAEEEPDRFLHEQDLIIHGDKTVLVLGCGHNGIVNILERAKDYKPDFVIGGYHLFNPETKKTAPDEMLDEIAAEMNRYGAEYFTCHCTGEKAYRYLAGKVGSLHYFSCGESLEI